jgi:hypothetical protein
MPEKIRFSTVLKDLDKAISELEGDELARARRGFAKLLEQNPPTDLTALLDALPKDLRGEGRTVQRALTAETVKRGDTWTTQNLAKELKMYLPALSGGSDTREIPTSEAEDDGDDGEDLDR